jgi:glutamate--cysteine ligase catalytic subunit
MGLLSEGKSLTPEQLRDVSNYIREHGITQFLHTWERVKDVENDELRFGDEIECAIMVVDKAAKTVKLSIRSAEVLLLLLILLLLLLLLIHIHISKESTMLVF